MNSVTYKPKKIVKYASRESAQKYDYNDRVLKKNYKIRIKSQRKQ